MWFQQSSFGGDMKAAPVGSLAWNCKTRQKTSGASISRSGSQLASASRVRHDTIRSAQEFSTGGDAKSHFFLLLQSPVQGFFDYGFVGHYGRGLHLGNRVSGSKKK